MSTLGLLLLLMLNTVEFDVLTIPLSSPLRITFMPSARGELRREGTVTRVKIDVERVLPPSTLGPAFNTYVVWAVSPEGILDNLGELDIKGTKGEFSATTRLTQFALFITAEPHYMVDQPSTAIAYRGQSVETDFRRKRVPIEVGAYDYSQLKPLPAAAHNSVSQARAAFQIAEAAGAERFASGDFRNAQVAMGALEELVNRSAPFDIIWPTANEVIRLSQRAAVAARGKR